MKKKYDIKGMHCRSCEILIEKNIGKIAGVRSAEVNHRKGIAEVDFAGGSADDAAVAKAVNESGYSLGKSGKLAWLSRDGETWSEIMFGVSALAVLAVIAKVSGVFDGAIGAFGSAPTYPIVFVIGLTAGISTCMAVIGGLVAGFSASYAETHQYASRWERFRPNLFFHAGRLVSYAIFGGAIGALGSAVRLSSGFTGALVVGAGLVMLYLGLKLTGVSPKLSNASLSLPKGFGRALGMADADAEYSHRGAFVGGALTFFLPCGFTQAMQVYAITTGSFVSGATIMLLFALGTMPGLLGVGALTAMLKGMSARIFFRFVGLAVLLLGLFNIANGYGLLGINLPLPSFGSGAGVVAPPPEIVDGVQVVHMTQSAGGYSPNSFTVKKGVPVRWVIDSTNAYTCAASLRMPAYHIGEFLQAGENVITFTPTETGPVRFTCGMGMYSGTFTVID